MADVTGLSLADLIPADSARVDAALKAANRGGGPLAAANLATAAAGLVDRQIDRALRSLLDQDVFSLLAQAWAKADEIRAYADPAKHPPEETSTLFLGEHSLSFDLKPTVDITIAPLPKISLEFIITLEAAFQLAELTIQDAHVKRIGRCDAALGATLKYGETPLHGPLETRHVTLIQPMVLAAPGIPIPKP